MPLFFCFFLPIFCLSIIIIGHTKVKPSANPNKSHLSVLWMLWYFLFRLKQYPSASLVWMKSKDFDEFRFMLMLPFMVSYPDRCRGLVVQKLCQHQTNLEDPALVIIRVIKLLTSVGSLYSQSKDIAIWEVVFGT